MFDMREKGNEMWSRMLFGSTASYTQLSRLCSSHGTQVIRYDALKMQNKETDISEMFWG